MLLSLYGGQRVIKVEELFYASDFERVLDPLANADQVQAAVVLLVG